MTLWFTEYYLPQPAKPSQDSTLKGGTTGVDIAQSQWAPPQMPPDKVVMLVWTIYGQISSALRLVYLRTLFLRHV